MLLSCQGRGTCNIDSFWETRSTWQDLMEALCPNTRVQCVAKRPD